MGEFEDLVTSNLADIQRRIGSLNQKVESVDDKVNALTNQVGVMRATQLVEKTKRDKLEKPIGEWSLSDSRALRSVIDSEKRRLDRTQQSQEENEQHDERLSRWRDRFTVAGISVAIIQATFDPIGKLGHALNDVFFKHHG